MSYNLLNLPRQIFCWGDYSDYYDYLVDGTKILHEYSDGQQDLYIGSLVYYSEEGLAHRSEEVASLKLVTARRCTIS